jgi:DNA-binding XRE family transcriptional regulator
MSEVKRTLIQVRREAKGLSRSQFAAKLGVTGGYVKVIEKMKVQPSPELLEKVGRELGIPHEKLMAEYRKAEGPEAAPPSRRKAGRKPRIGKAAPREQPRAQPAPPPAFPAPPAPLAAMQDQDEMVAIALRSQQGVELVLRAINERNQGRDAAARRLLRQFQQTLAELVARTARVAVSEEERRADEDAGGAADSGDTFLGEHGPRAV